MLGQYTAAVAGTVAWMPYHLGASGGLLLQAPGPARGAAQALSGTMHSGHAQWCARLPGSRGRQCSGACPAGAQTLSAPPPPLSPAVPGSPPTHTVEGGKNHQTQVRLSGFPARPGSGPASHMGSTGE